MASFAGPPLPTNILVWNVGQIQLAEVKRETFQRSRGIAEHKAREYEGAKAVARAQEMLVREATEKLQGRINLVKAKRVRTTLSGTAALTVTQ